MATALITAAVVLLFLSPARGQDPQPQGQKQSPSNMPSATQVAPQGALMPLGGDNITTLLAPPAKGGAPVGPSQNISPLSQDNQTATQTAPTPPLSPQTAIMPTQSPSPKALATPAPPLPPPTTPASAHSSSSAASAPMVQQSGPNNVSLAFDDADIFEIAHTIFGEILKVNYLIDARVKGRITFKTVKPVSNSDVLPIMSTIFRLNGVSIIEEHGLYRIIPLADISKEPTGVKYGKDTKTSQVRGFSVIQIVPLNFMGSKDMVEILTPFLSTGAVIKEVPGKNCIIISDTDENIQRLLQIVNIFDDDAFKDMKVELFVFKNLSIKDVIDDLKNTFPLFTATTKDSLKMKYLPIEKLNAILVVAPDEQYLKHFKKWVDIIDNVFEGAKPRIYVYPLQNSQADHIMSILSQVFSESGTSKTSQDKSSNPASSATKSTGTTGTTGTSALSSLSSLTSNSSTSSTTKTDSTKDSKKSSSSTGTGTANAISATNSILVSSETKLYYDDKLNSIIILALPKDYLYIEELIKKLDSVPRQVLIESLIIEITLNNEMKYGVEWFLTNNITVKNHTYTGAAMLESGGSANTGSAVIGLSSQLFSTTSGLSYAVFNGAGFLSALVQALSTETNVSVLSNPTILVSDNNEAKIQVGQKVPIVTSTANVSGTTTIQNQYQYQDTGVILTVKPQINDSGLVKLDVSQEVSTVDPNLTTQGVNSPTIDVRSVSTNLVVHDGASIAIGGLIQDKVSDSNNGIPFLSKIPIIGGLFGVQDKSHTRTELLIIITPHVVKNIADAARMTEEFKEKLIGLKQALSKDKTGLIPGSKSQKYGNPSPPADDPDKKENKRPEGATEPAPLF
ncbi:type II secretion system secretin GspD [Candidatus Magnetominusculus dajiuhuensis]|uniref:type II secretion system secretin GspD n=1 Tax=Candidatus Magnetominusculus dajiuhuensis TaxID=3137712 RepID=UPI003B43890B